MRASRAAVILLLAAGVLGRGHEAEGFVLALFERYLESLRQQAGIPGLSAAILQNRQIVWEQGFGLQDIERSVAADPSTPYPVADLTQTFAAVLVLQCAERGTLHLDEPVRRWTDRIPEPGATVRQVLAHTSDGTRSGGFRYDPERYVALTDVIDGCSAHPYRLALAGELLDRLAMVDSVPGYDLRDADVAAGAGFDPHVRTRYAAVLSRVAVPYRVDRRGRPAPSDYPSPSGVNASTGLISTVRDLARFDAALDDGVLLRPETLGLAWTNALSPSGVPLPFAFGWFVQTYQGTRLVWHFGLAPNAFSSLILKVPERDLTLILLANSDGLSAPFRLGQGDVTSSLFARVFLQLFL